MNFDPAKKVRYAKTWSKKAAFTRTLTKSHCCVCGKSHKPEDKDVEVHHLYYGVHFLWFTLPIPGFEIPIWQLVNLCVDCHLRNKNAAHSKQNYYVHPVKSKQIWGNHNYSHYKRYVRIKMLRAMFRYHPLTSLLFFCTLPLTLLLLI